MMTAGRFKQWGRGLSRLSMGIAAAALPLLASAQGAPAGDVEPYEPVRWQLNMTPGVSQTSHMDDLEDLLRGWGTHQAEAAGLEPGRLAEPFRRVTVR